MYWCYISEQPYQYQIHAKRGEGGQLKSQKRTLRVTFYQAPLPTKSLLCLFHICTVTQLTNTIAKSDKSIPVYKSQCDKSLMKRLFEVKKSFPNLEPILVEPHVGQIWN